MVCNEPVAKLAYRDVDVSDGLRVNYAEVGGIVREEQPWLWVSPDWVKFDEPVACEETKIALYKEGLSMHDNRLPSHTNLLYVREISLPQTVSTVVPATDCEGPTRQVMVEIKCPLARSWSTLFPGYNIEGTPIPIRPEYYAQVCVELTCKIVHRIKYFPFHR